MEKPRKPRELFVVTATERQVVGVVHRLTDRLYLLDTSDRPQPQVPKPPPAAPARK